MRNICILVGARPNFIKVAPLIRAIRSNSSINYRLVFAGSPDDPTVEDSLFSDLQMPPPDTFLGVNSNSLNVITSQVMERFDAWLSQWPADIVVVVDDLASTMAAAITAKKRGLCLAHLVAGTRSFDKRMPKEVNRLVIDALSDYLFTAGVRSTGIASRQQDTTAELAPANGTPGTYMVGNILMDNLRFIRQRLTPPTNLIDRTTPLVPGSYMVLTLNRKALLTDAPHLEQLLNAIISSANEVPVIAPLRVQAASVVQGLNLKTPGLQLFPPLPYLQFGWLTAHAKGIITDSGNVAEEATFNGVPCITLNSYTEHQERVTLGTNVLVGEDPEQLSHYTELMVAGKWKPSTLPDRWDGHTAERVLKIIAP